MDLGRKPALGARLLLVASLFGFLRIARNPIVIVEAQLGLSPSPLEHLFGIEGPFSGMTQASHRLAHFDLAGAIAAHPLVPLLWASVLVMILSWRFPKVKRRSDEVALFGATVAATVINNLV